MVDGPRRRTGHSQQEGAVGPGGQGAQGRPRLWRPGRVQLTFAGAPSGGLLPSRTCGDNGDIEQCCPGWWPLARGSGALASMTELRILFHFNQFKFKCK